jgi:hypothetical protein
VRVCVCVCACACACVCHKKTDWQAKRAYEIFLFVMKYWVYSSPNIVRVIKSRRLGWAGRIARMGEKRDVYRVLVG